MSGIRRYILHLAGLKKGALMLLSICLAGVLPAAGDSTLNRMVFESCDDAQARLVVLPDGEKRDFVHYLTGVLNLQLQGNISPTETAGASVDPRLGGTGFAAPGLFRAFDPVKDMEVKRCAVRLLLNLAPWSLGALPDFLSLSQLKTWPPDFKAMLQDSAFKVAVLSGAYADFELSDEVLEGIARFIGGENSVLAENILYELGKKSVPFLVSKLKSSDPRTCDALCRFLLEMDPEGMVIGEPLIELVATGSPDLLIKVAGAAGKLTAVYEQALPVLVFRLGNTQGLAHQAVLLALSDIFSRPDLLREIKIAPSVVRNLAVEVRASSGHEKEKLINGMAAVVGDKPELQKVLLEEVRASGSRDKVALLGALALADPDDEEFNDVSAFLKASEPQVAMQALLALSSFRYRNNDVLNAFYGFLKDLKKGRSESIREQFLLSVARAIDLLKPELLGPRFNPFLIEMLSVKETLPAELVFKSERGEEGEFEAPPQISVFQFADRSVTANLVKLIEGRDAWRKEAAMQALAEIKPADTLQLKTFIKSLADQSLVVRKAAYSGLRSAGKAAGRELEKLLKPGVDGALRLEAAQLLTEVGIKNSSAQKILKEAISSAPCRKRIEILVSLGNSRDYSVSSQEVEAVLSCAGKEGPLDGEIVEALTSVRLENQGRIAAVELLNSPISVQSKILFINRLPGSGMPGEKVTSVLTRLLSDRDLQLRLAIEKALAAIGSPAAEAVPALVSIATNRDTSEKEAGAAVLALSRIDPGAFDCENWILTRLAGDRSGQVAELVLAMRPESAVILLKRALRELSGEAQLVALRTVGDLSYAAYGVIPEILPWLSDENQERRLYALVAILKVDPRIPQAFPVLRKELVGVMSQQLIIERFPKSIAPVLEEIIHEPHSRLERRNATILLDNLQ